MSSFQIWTLKIMYMKIQPNEIPYIITMKVENIIKHLESKDFFTLNPFVPKPLLEFELNFEFASKYEFNDIQLDDLELEMGEIKQAIGRVYDGWTDCLANDDRSLSVDENGKLV